MSGKVIQIGFGMAALYNFIWGIAISLWPDLFWLMAGMHAGPRPFLVQGIGLFVALYGFGYYLVAARPARYPVLVLIGLLGKSLGPLGWAYYVWQGQLPLHSMLVNAGNDLIWLPLFFYYFYWLNKVHPEHKTSLYGRVMGSGFYNLPQTLQRFHNTCIAGQTTKASGVFLVKRGRSSFAKLIARTMGFKQDLNNAALELEVQAFLNYEFWQRSFQGGPTLLTRQWQHDGLLCEAAGPLAILFKLEPTPTGYRFVQQACLLRWLMIDVWPAMQIRARIRVIKGGWFVRVHCSMPGIGTIVKYGGTICYPTD